MTDNRGNLEHRAMIVKLTTSAWTASKTVPGISVAVAEEYEAQRDMAQVSKKLVDKAALKKVRAALDAAKVLHNDLTLPWADNGERLLPIKVHARYRERMDEAIAKADVAIREFARSYEKLVEQAQVSLGKMFESTDYPAAEAITGKFGVSYEINPVPASSHFVADLGDEDAARIKADIEARMKIKMDAAMVRIFERIEEALRHLIERLGFDEEGAPKRLHASTLDALKQLAEIVPSMNLTEDSKLNEIAQRIGKVLANTDVDDLRYKSTKPAVVAATTQRRQDTLRELETMASFYFGKPAADAG